MRIEVLGSGGAITTPRPLCRCAVCEEARTKGRPYSRTGPSVFVHGHNLLFDTPEEIKEQLNRSGIERIEGCFYSHWHPDHVMGRRVWEMHKDFRAWPRPRRVPTKVYVPERVAADFRVHLGTWDHLKFLESQGLIDIVVLTDEAMAHGSGWSVRPFPLAEDFVYGFLVDDAASRALIVMDELKGWDPILAGPGIDVAILPMGVVEFDIFSGERRIPEDHPVLRSEATFEDTLAIVRGLGAERVILSHIEEPNGLSYVDLLEVEEALKHDGLNVTFAVDSMIVDV